MPTWQSGRVQEERGQSTTEAWGWSGALGEQWVTAASQAADNTLQLAQPPPMTRMGGCSCPMRGANKLFLAHLARGPMPDFNRTMSAPARSGQVTGQIKAPPLVIYNHTAAGWCEHGRMQMFSSSNPRRLHIVSSARVQGWWRDGWRQCSGKSPSMSREVSHSDHENGRFETRTTINCKCTTVIVVRQHIQLHTLVGLVQNGSSCWTEGTIVSRARLAHSPSKRCFLFLYPTLYRRSRC